MLNICDRKVFIKKTYCEGYALFLYVRLNAAVQHIWRKVQNQTGPFLLTVFSLSMCVCTCSYLWAGGCGSQR